MKGLKMKLELSRTTNGLKTVLVKLKGSRAFAIQTCGGLFLTHRMSKSDFDEDVAKSEVVEYINKYGTAHQQKLLKKELKED